MDQRLQVLFNGPSTDFYSVGVDSSSDEEAKSSDDDIDDINEDKNESDSDSFEKEMESELNEEFQKHRVLHCHVKPISDQGNTTKEGGSSKETDTKYDDEYFSSGSDEDQDNVGGVLSKSKERRTKKTDDELLYDPDMDEEDENWVQMQRQGHHSQENIDQVGGEKAKTKAQKSTHTKPANSDAILSCPACLTTLCIDCQRHDIYKMQFRAMFVMNCNTKMDETLRCEAKKDKKKAGKKKQTEDQASTSSTPSPVVPEGELFHPVQCALCNTEVAVYDTDEIYHFFNVVESLS